MKLKLHPTPLKVAILLGFVSLTALQIDRGTKYPLMMSSSSLASVEYGPTFNPIEEALRNPQKLTPLPPERIDSETLWLARVIFSESKRVEEQALVAWVVRNRVETTYRGKRSYQSVALDPHQFSAFSELNPKRSFYTGLTPKSMTRGWQTALRVAYDVRHADETHRPFSKETRHFYSERSLGENDSPEWAIGLEPVEINYASIVVDEWRFKFYENVA